jgi:hypothetical protein
MAVQALADVGPQAVASVMLPHQSTKSVFAETHNLLSEINRAIDDGKISQRLLAQAVAAEIVITAAGEKDD